MNRGGGCCAAALSATLKLRRLPVVADTPRLFLRPRLTLDRPQSQKM